MDVDMSLINDIEDEEIIDPDLAIDEVIVDSTTEINERMKREIFTEGSSFQESLRSPILGEHTQSIKKEFSKS